MADFCDRLHYLSLNPAEAADYGRLAARLQELTGEAGGPDACCTIWPLRPSLYGVIPLHLKAAGTEPSPYAHHRGEAFRL